MTSALDTAVAMQCSPSYALHKSGITIDGGVKLDFGRYPYLPVIIDEDPRKMTVMKGAQMGFTIAAILKALVIAGKGTHNGYPIRGIGYWFPTQGEAQVFAKSRFTPLMEQNPHVWNPKGIDVDSAELKRVGNTAIYLRGAGQRGGSAKKSTSGVKSIPLDINIRDEADEMSDTRKDAIDRRLDGSPCPQQLDFSTPTIPGYGVDLDYQDSNQSMWHWKCLRCEGWTCLEDNYPDCIAEPNAGDPFYLCMKCREPLVKKFGEWVAKKPDIKDHIGLALSQMCSPTRTALDIVNAAADAVKTGRAKEFENQVLGRAYAETEDQITEEQLNDLLTEEARPLRHEGPACMGVDPGKIHWYEVRIRTGERDSVQIARGRADSFSELAEIAKKYNVEAGVMDQGADTSSVRDFVRNHPGWYGCLYVNAKKTDPDWNHNEGLVKVGRTWLLDDSHRAIVDRRVKFYRKDDFWHEQFVPQMTNLKRIVQENDETGERVPRWIVTGGRKNDHLRHASSYCHLALERVSLAHEYQRSKKRARSSGRGRSRSAMVM